MKDAIEKVKEHEKWLQEKGEKPDLSGANLYGADLYGATCTGRPERG